MGADGIFRLRVPSVLWIHLRGLPQPRRAPSDWRKPQAQRADVERGQERAARLETQFVRYFVRARCRVSEPQRGIYICDNRDRMGEPAKNEKITTKNGVQVLPKCSLPLTGAM